MRNEELLLSAMDGVKEEYLMEANEYKRGKTPLRRRGILIAAALAAVLAITAGAVTLSLRDAARADLGIDDPEKIEEYTEYTPEDGPQSTPAAPVEGYLPGGSVELVSTLCSGGDLVAYLSVPDCPAAAGEDLGLWDMGFVDLYEAGASEPMRVGIGFNVDETSYDPEAKTTLVRLRVMGLPENADHICVQVIHRNAEEYGVLYDMLEIPVTESVGLHAKIGKTVEHPNLEGFTGTIEEVEVYADYVSVKVKMPSYDETLAMLGDNAWEKLEMIVFGERIDGAPDAEYAYHALIDMMMNPYDRMTADPDSPQSPHYILEGAALNLKDGTTLVLAEQERELAGLWAFDNGTNETPMETGEWTFNCVLKNVLDLNEVESYSLDGETYPLAFE